MVKHSMNLELYYNGVWNEAPAYTRDGCKVRIGVTSFNSGVDPASAAITIDNRTFAYSPRSAVSPLFGKIGQNTPARIRVDYTPIVEDFEDATLNISIANSGSASWARNNTQAHTGSWSFKSGTITDSQFSTATITVPAGANTISFWYKVSSEPEFDYFSVSLDGVEVFFDDSGNKDWTLVSLDVSHTSLVALTYTKDGSASAGLDAAFVDDLQFDAFRVFGEVASWRPERAIKGDAWTKVEIAGVLQRVGRGDDVLHSAVRRAYEVEKGDSDTGTLLPRAYWPLEDGSGAIDAENAVASLTPYGATVPLGGFPLVPSDLNVAKFGSVSDTPGGSANLPDFSGGLKLEADIPGTTATSWAIQWVQRNPSNADHDTVENFPPGLRLETPGEASFLTVTFTMDPSITVLWGNDSVGILDLFTVFENAFDDQWHVYRVEFEQLPASAYRARLYIDNELAGTKTGLGTLTVYSPDHATLNHNSSVYMGSMGHVMTWGLADFDNFPYLDSSLIFSGYTGEKAADRFQRFCVEEGLIPTLFAIADFTNSVEMGPQRPIKRLELLDEIARTEDGNIFESRHEIGLTMRTKLSKLNRTPALTVSYKGHVCPPLLPVFGDEGIRNDVVASRPGGGSRRQQQLAGPHNLQYPEDDPEGVGPYRTGLNVNPSTEDALSDAAGWEVHLGTFNGTWYAVVVVDLDAAPGLINKVNQVGIGDVVAISDLPVDEALDTVECIVIGIEDDVERSRRFVTFFCVPAQPYQVGILAITTGDTDPFVGHAETDGSSTNGATLANASTFSVATTSGPLWTTVADDFPFDVVAGGQRISVSSISGGSSPQTFTVATYSGAKKILYPIPAGSDVQVYQPIILT